MSSVMLRCTLGDLVASEGVLRLPERGDWVGRCTLGWPELPVEDSPASLIFTREDGAIDEFVGTIRRSRIVAATETISVTLVGGQGRLLAPELPPRHHTAGSSTVPAGVVAAGIAQAAGETLAEGVEEALDGYALARWTRLGAPAWDALDMLAASLGLGWRVLADGTIWVGVETWPPVTSSPVDGVPEDGVVTYNPDGAPLRPGTTIDGLRAREVLYTWSSDNTGAEVRAAMSGDPVRAPALDLYRGQYTGTVVDQAADGSLHVVCDDARIGKDLRGIPLRVGLPGMKVTMPGVGVRIAFENGDPRGACAIEIDQDPTASKPLALQDDSVDSGWLSAVASAMPGAPILFALSPTPLSVPGEVHIIGKITGPCHAYVKGKALPS